MNELKLFGLDNIKPASNQLNILKIIGCQRDENIHSDILCRLFESEAGNKFICSILDILNITYPRKINEASIKVYREYNRHDLTIIFNRMKFLVAIENKIDAEEGEKQIARYQKYLAEYYQNYSGVYLFLTPDGRESSTANKSSKFKCHSISYRELLESLYEIKNIGSISNCVSTLIENIKENITMDKKDIHAVNEFWGKKENRDKIKKLIDNRPKISKIKDKLFDIIGEYLKTKNDEIDEKQGGVISDDELQLWVKSLNGNNIPVIFLFYDMDKRENAPALRIVLYGEGSLPISNKRIKEYQKNYPNFGFAFERVRNWSCFYALYAGKSLEPDFLVTEDHDYGDKLVDILFREFKKEYEHIRKII
jgi:hypothetical protein